MSIKKYLALSMAVAVILLFLFTSLFSGGVFGLKSVHRVIEIKPATFVEYLGRFHPVAVHFPIAFTFGAILADILFLFTHRECLTVASRLMLSLALMGMVIAVPLGFAAIYENSDKRLVDYHEAIALVSLVLMFMATGVREAVERKYVSRRWALCHRTLLLLAALFVTWAAFLGGELVHGVGHLSWPS